MKKQYTVWEKISAIYTFDKVCFIFNKVCFKLISKVPSIKMGKTLEQALHNKEESKG